MTLRLSIVVLCAMVFSAVPLRALEQEAVVQIVIRMPTVTAAIELQCSGDEACDIQVGSFKVRLALSQRGARISISDENVDFVFYDNTPSASIALRRTPVNLQVYDPNAPDYVLNDLNNPVGIIEIRVLDDR